MSTAAIAPGWGLTAATESTTFDPEISIETVPCPNCDGQHFDQILEGSDFLTGIKTKFRLVRCVDCDLVLTNPRPTMESLGLFYPKEYSPYRNNSLSKRRWQWLEKLALQGQLGYPPQPASMLTKLLGRLAMLKFSGRQHRHGWLPFRGSGRLLDVGCGAGAYMERMQAFGWTVTGLEYAADVARRVEERTGIKVLAGTLPHPELANGSFDAVTLWHVLEHVPNPRQLVQSAVNLLSPGGLLVIEVPNIESQAFVEYGEHWFGLELPRHLQHFSPKTLKAMMPEDKIRVIGLQQFDCRSISKRSAKRAADAGRTDQNHWQAKAKRLFAERFLRSGNEHSGDVIRIIGERLE